MCETEMTGRHRRNENKKQQQPEVYSSRIGISCEMKKHSLRKMRGLVTTN